MARIRTVKPEFWQDEKLAPLAPIDRLVFLGLIGMADDAGRLLDNIKTIDAFVFPMTSETAGPSVERLITLGRVLRGLTRSGQAILQLAGWHHQKIDKPNLKGALPQIVTLISPTDRRNVGDEPSNHTSTNIPVPTTGISTSDLDQYPTAAAQKFSTIRDQLPERSRKAFDGLRKASHGPTGLFALCAELEMIAKGERNIDPKPTWEGIGMALEDLVLNGQLATARALRTYVADAMRMITDGTKSRKPRGVGRNGDDDLPRNPGRRARALRERGQS